MITGTEGLSKADIVDAVERGGRFVVFRYCISVIVLTIRLSSDVYFLRPGEKAWGKRVGFAAVSFFLGWWGIPFGIVYTLMSIGTCLGGGEDVTGTTMDALGYGSAGGIDAKGLAAIFGPKPTDTR